MSKRTLRGQVAVVGIGETTYFKHGKSPDPEFVLALRAILAACLDAGVDPRDIDGFASFSDDRNEPPRLAAALGIHELRFSNMQWTGGGGGVCAAVANAASAIVAGMADCVVVFRSLAQGQHARFGRSQPARTISGDLALQIPYGAMTPAQRYSMKVMRYMHEYGIGTQTLRAIAMASYHHAQSNPRAVMQGRRLDEVSYETSRWIAEPHRLYDCCMENDGAAAIILVSAERAKDFSNLPAYILGAAAGGSFRSAASSANAPDFASGNFGVLAPRMYAMAGISPSDVDVVQCYENFTGGVLMALAEHGFFEPAAANEFLTMRNLTAEDGALPLNTSGGHLAECYMHGMGLHVEAVRQLRGQSPNPVTNAQVAVVIGGPMVTPASTLAYGSENTL